jgi:hypothetical protein
VKRMLAALLLCGATLSTTMMSASAHDLDFPNQHPQKAGHWCLPRMRRRRLRGSAFHGVVSIGASTPNRLGLATRRLRPFQFQPTSRPTQKKNGLINLLDCCWQPWRT